MRKLKEIDKNRLQIVESCSIMIDGKEVSRMKERILKYRKEHGLSQVDLAKLCGISPTTIVRIENGKKCNIITEGKINKVIGNE